MASPDPRGHQTAPVVFRPADLPGNERSALPVDVTPLIFRAALSLHAAAEATDDPAVRSRIYNALTDLDAAIQSLNEARVPNPGRAC